jgi:hypothetical protein
MPLAIFGIESDGLNLAVNLLILFLVVVYLALIAYTYLDARRRLEDPVLVACATVAALFPFVGTVIYSILRPPEFLEDKRERELETRAAELRLRQLQESSCPNCQFPVERNWLRCPSCRARIKDPCESCGKPVDPRWSICPHCETPTRRAAPEPERRVSSSRSSAPPEGKRPKRQASASAPRPARAKRPVSRTSSSEARAASAKSKSGGGSSKPRPATRRAQSGSRPRTEPGDDAPHTAPAS